MNTTTRIFPILALLAALLLWAPSTQAAPPEDTCPVIVQPEDLRDLVDQDVTGWTVFAGTESESFPAKIISVQDNAWEPGDQIVWARASGADIEEQDGIAYGMSGSPVYTAEGHLIGALAYGLSANSRVFGITPAYQMTSALPDAPVTLSAQSKRAIQKATSKRATGPYRMAPVMQTNARGPLVDRLRDRLAERGVPLVSVPGGSSRGALPVPGASIEAGGVLVASLAKGRTDLSGLGTATYVCENQVLGFGHPMFGSPNSRAILSNGEVYATITEPLWGPYKYGVPTTTLGTMLRDNSYAIGGTIGAETPTVPVVGRVGSFEGELTQVAKLPINSNALVEDDWGYPYFSYAVGLSLYNEIRKQDSEYSQFSSASGGWTIRGTANGKPFSFTRSNAWSGYESDAAVGLMEDLDAMIFYGSEYGSTGLEIDSVEPNVEVYQGLRSYNLVRVDARVGKKSWRKNPNKVRVRRGQSFAVRLYFKPNSGPTIKRTMRYRSTGKSGFWSLGEMAMPESGQFGVASFQELLRQLGAIRNTKLQAQAQGARYVSGSLAFDRVVQGYYGLQIEAVGKKPSKNNGSTIQFADSE